MTRATELLLDGVSPRRVATTLGEEFRESYARTGGIPTWRTLYDIGNELRRSAGEGAEAWSLLRSDPEEARLALPVMRELNRTGHGFLGWNLPKDVVHWIAVVRTADPDIPLVDSFYQALRYVQAEAGISEPAEADRWLVMESWKESPAERTRAKFQQAAANRRRQRRRAPPPADRSEE